MPDGDDAPRDGGNEPDASVPDAGSDEEEEGGSEASRPGDIQAVKLFGGRYKEEGHALAVTPDGNLVLTGLYSASGINFGGGPLPDHNVPDDYDYGDGMPDMFVAKVTPEGAHVWSRGFGGPESWVVGEYLAVVADGAIYVTGMYGGEPDLGTGPLPVANERAKHFLLKLSAEGATQWVLPLEGDIAAAPSLVATQDHVTTLFSMRGAFDVAGTPLQCGGPYCAALVRFSPEGAVLSSRLFASQPDGQVGGGRLAESSDGSTVLALGVRGAVQVGAVTIHPPDATTVVLKLSASGEYLWHKALVDVAGDPEDLSFNAVYSLQVGPEGHVLAGGAFRDPFSFAGRELTLGGANHEAFLVLFAGDGTEQWAQVTSGKPGGSSYTFAFAASAVFGEAGRIYATGFLGGTFTLCGRQITGGSDLGPAGSYGPLNAFAASINLDGTCNWARDYTAHSTMLYTTQAVYVPEQGLFVTGDAEDFQLGSYKYSGWGVQQALLMRMRP